MVPSIWRASLLSSAILLLHAAAAVRGEVITTPTGLKYEDENPTSCDRPTQKGDLISVHYIGTLENGKEFDQSYKRGAPFAFRLGMHQVISGWDEGLENMCIGVKRKLIIPPELGYGSRDMGDIPPNSVLIFETQLMHIKGVPDPPPPTPPPANVTEPAKAEPADKDEAIPIDAKPAETAAAAPKETQAATTGADKDTPMTTTIEESKGECRLLGPFALLVQSALGVLALLSLVFKRWRERPRRPLKIWFFDVSKQVVGTALLHVANLAMSMLSSGIDAAAHAAKIAEASKGEGEELPNPCSFYLLNLAIDVSLYSNALAFLDPNNRADNNWHPDSGGSPQASPCSLPPHTTRKPSGVTQVRSLRLPATRYMVDEAMHRLFHWTLRHEALCPFHVPGSPLAPMGG